MNDTNKIAVAETLKEKISDRIRNSFVELIPEDAWKAMVQEELNTFMKKGLPQLLQCEFKERFSKAIKDELNKPEYQGYWDIGSGQQPSEAVKEIVKQVTPELITAMWGSVIQRCVEEVRNTLSQTNQQY